MTKQIIQGPDPGGSLLLREFNHRTINELTCAICAVSAKAFESDNVVVKAALLDVVDLLHDYADVHKALRIPDPGRLADAARYLQQLCLSIAKYRMNRLGIRVLFSADDLLLEGERCWKLGLIVSELLTNVARHALISATASQMATASEHQHLKKNRTPLTEAFRNANGSVAGRAGQFCSQEEGNPYNMETDYQGWSAFRLSGAWDSRNDCP